ncbi:MAG: ORF6N domain-containing protein [Bacteroidetes bacterium]|nr:ORF6N domain-containing protein [Bacteroidota bacterium]
MATAVAVPDETIVNKIYLIRGKKVMLDKDLAELYRVMTRDLNKAVKRNLKRFPDDFMFQLTEEEFKDLMFQFGTSSWGGTMLLTHKDILLKLEQLEKQVTQNSEDIQMIFTALKKLLIPPEQSNRRRIGFRRPNEIQSETPQNENQ